MFSLTCKIGIKAVVYLAFRHDRGEKSGIREIAEFIGASEHTVGKLLQQLVRQGVINSVKGPSGGFYLSKEQLRQPIINIIEAIDGKNIFRECGLGLSECSSSHPCPIHNTYKEARDIMEKMCRQSKVIDLCEPVSDGLAYLIG
jgi:Rrf2 family protein